MGVRSSQQSLLTFLALQFVPCFVSEPLWNARSLFCEECQKNFTTYKKLRRHLQTVHTREHQCPKCKRRCSEKSNLQRHMMIHDNVRLWQCDICLMNFTTQFILRNHLRTHTGQRPFCCTVCNQTFSQKASFIRHQAVHTIDKPHTCRYCNRSFRQEITRNEHEFRVHRNPSTIHVCAKCSETFRFKKAWSAHMDAAHGNLACQFCPETFAKEKSRAKHCEVAHPFHAPYLCSDCDFRCYTWKDFKAHKDDHARAKPRPYQCRLCARTFPTAQSHLVHNRTHSNEKPYVCGICQRSFGDVSNMRRHLDMHARQMFRCVRCGLEFQDFFSLLCHMGGEHPNHANRLYLPLKFRTEFERIARGLNISKSIEFATSRARVTQVPLPMEPDSSQMVKAMKINVKQLRKSAMRQIRETRRQKRSLAATPGR